MNIILEKKETDNLFKIIREFIKSQNKNLKGITTINKLCIKIDITRPTLSYIKDKNKINVFIFARIARELNMNINRLLSVIKEKELSLNEKQYADAIAWYQKIIQNYPENENAKFSYLNIGECYLDIGDTSNAETTFNAVVEKYAKSETANKAILTLGKVFLAQNRLRMILMDIV